MFFCNKLRFIQPIKIGFLKVFSLRIQNLTPDKINNYLFKTRLKKNYLQSFCKLRIVLLLLVILLIMIICTNNILLLLFVTRCKLYEYNGHIILASKYTQCSKKLIFRWEFSYATWITLLFSSSLPNNLVFITFNSD